MAGALHLTGSMCDNDHHSYTYIFIFCLSKSFSVVLNQSLGVRYSCLKIKTELWSNCNSVFLPLMSKYMSESMLALGQWWLWFQSTFGPARHNCLIWMIVYEQIVENLSVVCHLFLYPWKSSGGYRRYVRALLAL